MAEFIRVASVDEIPVGSFKSFEILDESILVIHTENGFFALINQCTHDGAAISDGELINREVVCARHGARFDVETGAVTHAPAVVPIETFEVKIDGSDVLVGIED